MYRCFIALASDFGVTHRVRGITHGTQKLIYTDSSEVPYVPVKELNCIACAPSARFDVVSLMKCVRSITSNPHHIGAPHPILYSMGC